MIVHRRPRGGGFSPFPFIPGGRHDPLGGMLSSLPTSLPSLPDSIHIEIQDEQQGAPRADLIPVAARETMQSAMIQRRRTRRSTTRASVARRVVAEDRASELVVQLVLEHANRTNVLSVPEYRSSYRSHRPGAPNPRSADDGMFNGPY